VATVEPEAIAQIETCTSVGAHVGLPDLGRGEPGIGLVVPGAVRVGAVDLEIGIGRPGGVLKGLVVAETEGSIREPHGVHIQGGKDRDGPRRHRRRLPTREVGGIRGHHREGDAAAGH